jgi:DNA-directed RNA polymerase specialized sigma24 family protein
MSHVFEKARKGDRHAAESVCCLLQPRIEKMAGYFGKQCGIDSDDLRQEAWVAVLETLPALDLTIGSPEQHLLKRARWRILDTIRYQRRRQHAPLEDAENDGGVYLDIHSSFDMDRLMARLSPIQTRILRCLMEGYTWREAGSIVGCTSPNVAYHVRKIRDIYLELEGAGPVPRVK